MDLIEFKVLGTDTLEQINSDLYDEEIGGLEFVDSKLGAPDNLFLLKDTGLEPRRATFIAKGGAGPAGAVAVWEGKLFVDGKKAATYVLWRPKAATKGAPAMETFNLAAPGAMADILAALAADKAPAFPSMRADVVVSRALSATGKQTRYVLGGSAPSLSAAGWPQGAGTDCSGFVAWCFRMSRKVDHPLYRRINGGWFETTAVHADGMQDTGFFSPVATATPGCVVVFPDKGKKQGHMGIVVAASGPGIEGVDKVVHCSSGSYARHGDAIRQTSAALWKSRGDSLIVQYAGNG